MAERDSHVTGDEGRAQASPEELQRRLRTTRESITQTVAELKSTMNHEYQHTKERAVQSIDWQVQMRKYPVAACLGALAVGFLAGRALGHARDEDDGDYGYSGSRFGGQSLADSSAGSEHHLISPEVRRRASARVEGVLTTLADNFLNELTRVGRDVVVPGLIGALTSKLQNVTGQQGTTGQEHGASAFNTGTQNAGGTGSFGSGTSQQTGGFQGRSL